MTTEMTVEVPISVPPSVLVPTGEIAGIAVETEAPPVVEAAIETAVETPAATEAAESEEVSQMVVMKRKRGRPPMSANKKAEITVRKEGRAFWEMSGERELSGFLSNTYGSTYQPFVLKVMKQGYGVVKSYDNRGLMTKPREEVEALVVQHGGRLVHHAEYVSTYVWKDTFLKLSYGAANDGKISIHTCDETVHAFWSAFGDVWLKAPVYPPRRPQIKSFLNTVHGIEVMPIGELNDVLIEDNYLPEVVKDYKYICEQFTASDPVGRLAILEGVPGTGKTRLIRAMICELMDSANCILVAPNALEHLSGAAFLGALIREHHSGLPIVLILEDADACLIKRDEDKASLDALTGLLNLSDGILGATLDIRIIATTNAKLETLDAAVMRPGRLIRRVNLGPLPKEQAEAVFTRLTSRTQVFDAGATIATVYAAAAAMGDLERAAREAQAAADKAAFEQAVVTEESLDSLE